MREQRPESILGPSAPPYQDLYVYLIRGLLSEKDEIPLGKAFLGNWVEGKSSFLFFSTPSREPVDRLLKTRPDLALEDDYHFSYDDWQGGGLDILEIDPFVIVPPWLKTRSNHEFKIFLDPGVVFGNGLHPTTRACLKALSRVAGKPPMGRVLDLGTGSGVLSIAAALLGAREVLAIDLNPLCVKTADKNVSLNHLKDVIRVVEGDAEAFGDYSADLVIANIQHDVIKRFLERSRLREKVQLIISGLMRTQSREIKGYLEGGGFKVVHEWDHEMTWFTFLAESDN